MNKADLEQYYLNTTYSVFINDITYDCKIGEKAPTAINKLVEKEQSAAILTAWNPRSEPLTIKENTQRNSELYSYLLQKNFIVLKAMGQGRDKNWPAEESFFISGLNKKEAKQIAIQFEQNAYVWIEREKPIALIFSSIWSGIV